jgi:hypothetical protein
MEALPGRSPSVHHQGTKGTKRKQQELVWTPMPTYAFLPLVRFVPFVPSW